MRVPGGLAHQATLAPGSPWRTRTQAWPWALTDRPAASVGHWAFLLGLGLVLSKPMSLCWQGVKWNGGRGHRSPVLCRPSCCDGSRSTSEAFIAWIHIKGAECCGICAQVRRCDALGPPGLCHPPSNWDPPPCQPLGHTLALLPSSAILGSWQQA